MINATDPERLVTEHFDQAMRIAAKFCRGRSYVSGWDENEAQSAASIGLMQAAQRYDPVTYPDVPFGSFMCQRILWRLRTGRRTRRFVGSRTDKLRPQSLQQEEYFDVADCRCHATDDAQDLPEALLAPLPRHCQDLLRLIFVNGLSTRRAGRELGMAEHQVYELYDQVIAYLREQFGVEENSPDQAECQA